MENAQNPLRLLIKGNHYYTTPFVFSNVYGRSAFYQNETEDNEPTIYQEIASELFQDNYYEYDRTEKIAIENSSLFPIFSRIYQEMLSHSQPVGIYLTQEEASQVELYTDGLIEESDGIKIIYGDSDFPITVNITEDGIVTLESENEAVPSLTFEKGKRHFVNLSPFVKLSISERELPLQVCIYTYDIKNELQEESRSLFVTYSIEIAGTQAEKTSFSITLLR